MTGRRKGTGIYDIYNWCKRCGEYRHKTYFFLDSAGVKRDPVCGQKLRLRSRT